MPISRADVLNTVLERAFAVLGPEQGAIFLKGADGKLFRAAERQSSVSAGPLLVSSRLAEEVTVKGAAALEGDIAVELLVVGAVDDTRAPFAELLEDAVIERACLRRAYPEQADGTIVLREPQDER